MNIGYYMKTTKWTFSLYLTEKKLYYQYDTMAKSDIIYSKVINE